MTWHGRRYIFAWRRAVMAVGWWLLPIGLVGMFFFGLMAQARDPIGQMIGLSAVAAVGALIGGVQASLILAPADDAAFEIVLAAPRPLAMILIERLIVVFVMNAAIAAVGAVVFDLAYPSGETVIDQLARWFPPFTAMVGLGMTIAIVSRKSGMGALLAILLVGSMLFGGFAFLGLFDWAWTLHLFLPVDQFSAEQVFINRTLLTAIGAALIAYSFSLLRNHESLLAAHISA